MHIFKRSKKIFKFGGFLLLNFILIASFLSGALATTARFASHFDDEITEIQRRVCDNTYLDLQNLRVNFSMGEGKCLIRGVNYSYATPTGSGPTHSVILRFLGDSNFVDYSDNSISHVSNIAWHLFNCTGSTYLLDDDPTIAFVGTQPSDNCIWLCGDTPSRGFSYYNTGSGWTLDSSCEYLVKLMYEWIIKLNITKPIYGNITSSDNIDAYFVNLTGGVPYMFMLDRVSGTGNLSIRLVANQELTNNVLATSFNPIYPKYMGYMPSSNTTFVLLIEAKNAMRDIANYKISYYIDQRPTSNTPNDITTIKSGTETINWILRDDFGGSYYRVLVNSTPSSWRTWVNNTNLQYPIDRSAPGRYNYTIVYNDTGNNWGTPDTVIVNILDSLPTSNQPLDIKTAVNSSRTIPWILKDDYGAGYYRVFVNMTPSKWQKWINNSNLNYPINTSKDGTFNYAIQYNDSGGNLGIIDSVIITIKIDKTPPTSNKPSNLITNKNGKETIGWYLYDDFAPDSYRVLVNKTPSNWNQWINSTNLQYPIDRSAPGVFNYTIFYNDTGNNWGIPSTVFVTILDNPPSSNYPADVITSTKSITTIPWNLKDDFGAGFYRVLINSTPSAWKNWVNNSILNYPINTTIVGNFNYTIQYNDSAGQLGIPDTVLVKIVLDAPPKCNNPANITTYVGYSKTINWILTDDIGPGYYRVLINGSPKNWSPWINNTVIYYPINTTIAGIFTYTIQYNDSVGQLGTPNTVTVKIFIDKPPQSNQPSDITTYTRYSKNINWILTDDLGAGYYRVFVNSTPNKWKPWINNTAINYPINTTKTGTFIYTINFNDSFGQLGTPDSVIVTILIDNPPQSNQPADIITTQGYGGFIGWILTDDVGAGYYRVLINNTPKPWNPWTNNVSVNHPINTAKTGTFIYTIQYNDSFGQLGIPNTVKVIVNQPISLLTSKTQINLTCTLNGTVIGNKDGFSIQVNRWNSTFINMTVSKVNLQKFFYPIEAGIGAAIMQIDTQQWVMGFNITDSCVLNAVDFRYSTGFLIGTPYTEVFIYNATYSIAKHNIIPDKIIYNKSESALPYSAYQWVSANGMPYWNGTLKIKPTLDITKTYKRTFFIGFTSNATLYWHGITDANNGDQGLVYQGFGVPTNWQLDATDLTLRLSLLPTQNEKMPSQINMTINSKPVTISGKWNTSGLILPLPSGLIPFQVHSTWYNISYRINWTAQLQNITIGKTVLSAILLNKLVLWNVTISTAFLANSVNKRINITIPATWNASKVFKGASLYLNWVELLRIPKKSVVIRAAGNGIWVVQCNGYNWISNLTVYKQGIPLQKFYTLDTVKVAASLIRPVNDGVNNAKLNITSSDQTLLGSLGARGIGSFINLTWNIAQYIHTNGRYGLFISWFNGTEVGIYNTSISIYNSSSLVIISPNHKGTIIEMSKGAVFNLIIYYNMTFWKGTWSTLYLNGTMGAIVKYKFMSSTPQPMNPVFIGGAWAWTITINSPITYGSYLILVNASAWQEVQNFTNYAITLKIKEFGSTLIFNDTAKETFWKTLIAFSFTYTNQTGYSIQTSNITINWKYNFDGSYRGVLIKNFNYSLAYNPGTGVYTILFANFSAHKYNLLFYIDSDIYQSQEAYLTLIFTNITTSLSNQTIVPRLVYRQNGVFNITIYYKDLINNIGIPNGVIQSNWSLIKNYIVQELSAGYYRVCFNISKVFLNNYSVLLRASKINYQTANLIIHLEIYGYPASITNLNGANLTGTYAKIYAMDNWTLRFNYINASNGKGMVGATVTANFGGYSCAWRNTIGGNYSVWADSSKLNAPMADHNYTLQILIGKSFYEQCNFTITINILKLPTQLYPDHSLINAKIDDFIEVRVQLNDTRNHQGVNGLVWYKLNSTTKQMQPTGILGIYTTTLNLTNYSPGLYRIQLNSWALDHQNATISIILNVSRLNVVIIAENGTVSGYINDLLNINIQLKDSKDRIVENLVVKYKIESLSIENSFIYRGNGFYGATLNLTGFNTTLTYLLKIESPSTSKYNRSYAILTLKVNKIRTSIIPFKVNITGYFGEQYALSARYFDNIHGTYIDAANLQYQIIGKVSPTILPFIGAGTYQTTLNFTAIGVGDFIIKLCAISSAFYQAGNVSIALHIRAKIQTQLLIFNPIKELEEEDILNITAKLQTVSFIILKDKEIGYSASVKFNNGSSQIIQQFKYTNNLGIVIFQYRIPNDASSIDIIVNFAGTTNLTAVWNVTSIVVLKISYSLIVRVQSNVRANDILLIRADLSSATQPIGNALINFTIIVAYSGNITQKILLWGITAINGTATIRYTVPSNVISLYIVASYQSKQGTITNSDPKIVIAIEPGLIELGKWLPIIMWMLIIAIIIIIGAAVYYKVIRPKFRSIETQKRQLIQKRAENRREIARITREIQLYRENTLKEAEIAAQNMEFDKAAKLYEKTGNLTLELTEKSVAKEFFAKAKEMEEKSNQKERQSEMREQREKLLETARVAIRERNVVEAARNYRQVAELSRMLGEREQAEKFLKLANAANERIIALKEGDMRKKSGMFLSRADKAMGKQDFIEAAENFEEAAKIMLLIGEEEGTSRFVNWAKLARERHSLANAKSREDWIQSLTQNQNQLVRKAKELIEEQKFEEAVKVYTTLTIYAMELGKSELIEKFKKDINYYKKQATQIEGSAESRGLADERKKLLLNVDDAIRNNRYSLAAKYFNRIATITEMIEGKEVARTYLKQANYYFNKAQERKVKEKEVPSEIKIKQKVEMEKVIPTKKAAEKTSEEEFEEKKLEIATTIKRAREVLKTGKPILAKDLYQKAATIAETIGDEESMVRYKQKAEEIEILQPKKVIEDDSSTRRRITELTVKAEKALKKKKFLEAKNFYEEISELFLQLGDDDAANEFAEKASSLKRLVK